MKIESKYVKMKFHTMILGFDVVVNQFIETILKLMIIDKN